MLNKQLSKRWSTYCNIATILVAAFTPLATQFGIPDAVMPYVLLGTSLVTLGAQAVKQGKFDD
ncbi:TMhelix containing protein [Vibrio phage 1.250.O._10N.261.55.E11]|nr:TMhelix containing protein [Vibrio phage 1.250.O._10N.261.55.E11]